MTLSGKYRLTRNNDETRSIYEDSFGTPVVTVANNSLGDAAMGGVIGAISNAGGTLFDSDNNQFIVGTLDQLMQVAG